MDFGIASATTDEKLTQLGTAVGTWKYMAPERFSNDEVTYRADIYALACVLYECLIGAPPYRADSATTLVTAHLMDPIPQVSTQRAGIPKGFDAVIARGMAKKPEDRYASAGDFARAAHDALSNPDQDHAEDILRRSRESTLPGTAVAPTPSLPTGTPPSGMPPTPYAQPPTYGDQPGSGPLQRPSPTRSPVVGAGERPDSDAEPTHPGSAVLPGQWQLGRYATRRDATAAAERSDSVEPGESAFGRQAQSVAHRRRPPPRWWSFWSLPRSVSGLPPNRRQASRR